MSGRLSFPGRRQAAVCWILLGFLSIPLGAQTLAFRPGKASADQAQFPAGVSAITMSPGELKSFLLEFTFQASQVSRLYAVLAEPNLPDFVTFGFNAADVISSTRVNIRMRLTVAEEAFGGVFPSSVKFNFVDILGSLVVSSTKEFTLTIDAPPPPDDHGDDCESATPVSLTSGTPGFLAPGEMDFFQIQVKQAGTLEASSIGEINTLGTLYDDSCQPLLMDDDGGADENFRMVQALDPGTYYVSVSGSTAGIYGDYVLNMAFTPLDPFVNFLYLPQLVNGAGFTSRLQLLSGNDDPTRVRFEIRGDSGELSNIGFGPPDVSISGEEATFEVPPRGLGVFETNGIGTILAASLTVISDQPLTGSLVFGGEFGLAGVDVAQEVSGKIRIPVQRVMELEYNTGVALQNLEEEGISLQVRLLDKEENLLATAPDLELAALGHRSLFVDDFTWQQEVDFTNFEGILEISSTDDRFAAVALLTRPGQLASLPVTIEVVENQ